MEQNNMDHTPPAPTLPQLKDAITAGAITHSEQTIPSGGVAPQTGTSF